MNRRYAKALRKKIEMLASTMPDKEAVNTPELFPMWNPSAHYSYGDRVCYEGKLYKVLQSHDAQLTWTPVDTPSLFAEIFAGQEGTEIGEWKQPDSTNPYMKGDKVTFNGKTYESAIDNNVWSPADYPAGWKEV